MRSISVRLSAVVLIFCNAEVSCRKKGIWIFTNEWYFERHLSYALLLVFSLFSGACGSSRKLSANTTSIWVENPIVVDGNNNDWQLPYPFTENKEAKIQYAIANNKRTLYLTLKTSDEITKKKIIKNGLTVYIDTYGSKDHSVFITFQLVPPHSGKMPPGFPGMKDSIGGNMEMPRGAPSSFPPGDMPAGRPGTKMPPKDYKPSSQNDMTNTDQLRITSVQVSGIQNYNGIYLSPDNPPGIIVAVAYNDYNEMVWEISVEFQTFYKAQIEQQDANRKISIGLLISGVNNEDLSEINSLKISPLDAPFPGNDRDNNKAKAPGGMPNDGMGGGGMSGGGMGGGGMPGGEKMQGNNERNSLLNTISEERERALKNVEIWKPIKLHYQ